MNPERHYYSHEDQEVRGLQFRVFYSDNNISLYLIKGEETEIEKYKARFGTRIKELADAEMQAEMDKVAPARTETCWVCGGTGKIVIPRFNPAKAKTEL